MSEKKERETAYHEAEHTIVCLELNREFEFVAIEPSDDSAGHRHDGNDDYFGDEDTSTIETAGRELSEDPRHVEVRSKLEKEIVITMAGEEATFTLQL